MAQIRGGVPEGLRPNVEVFTNLRRWALCAFRDGQCKGRTSVKGPIRKAFTKKVVRPTIMKIAASTAQCVWFSNLVKCSFCNRNKFCQSNMCKPLAGSLVHQGWCAGCMDLLNDCGFSFSFSGLLKFYSKAEKSRTKIQDETKHVFVLFFSIFHMQRAKKLKAKSDCKNLSHATSAVGFAWGCCSDVVVCWSSIAKRKKVEQKYKTKPNTCLQICQLANLLWSIPCFALEQMAGAVGVSLVWRHLKRQMQGKQCMWFYIVCMIDGRVNALFFGIANVVVCFSHAEMILYMHKSEQFKSQQTRLKPQTWSHRLTRPLPLRLRHVRGNEPAEWCCGFTFWNRNARCGGRGAQTDQYIVPHTRTCFTGWQIYVIYIIYMRKRAMTTLASITCSFYNEFSNHRRISILRLCNVSKMCARKVTWSQGDLQTRSLLMVPSMWFRF